MAEGVRDISGDIGNVLFFLIWLAIHGCVCFVKIQKAAHALFLCIHFCVYNTHLFRFYLITCPMLTSSAKREHE